MTAQHTPGPWGMETKRTSCGVCHQIGPWPHKWRAGEAMSACIYDDYPSPPEGTDTMLANARLIAAAPDLLEALKYYADTFCEGFCGDLPQAGTYHPDMDDKCGGCKARAAIAKARGQA